MSMSGVEFSHNGGACCSICGRSCREPDLLWQAAACPVLEVGHLLALSTFCDLTSPALARPAATRNEAAGSEAKQGGMHLLIAICCFSCARRLKCSAWHLGCTALPDSDDSLIKDLVSLLLACTSSIAFVAMCRTCRAAGQGVQGKVSQPAVDCPGSTFVADIDA